MLSKQTKRLLLTMLIVVTNFSFITYAASPQTNENMLAQQAYLGLWKSIDDETKQPRSLIKISIENDQLIARIKEVFPIEGQPNETTCKECSGDLHQVEIVGLNILTGMTFEDGVWDNGQILDPKNGKFYDAKIWLDNKKLKVRGYIGFFFRTQTWLPAKTDRL